MQVAALAIIMIRCLDVLMILNTLGARGIGEFIHRSVQTWNLTLVFLSSLVLGLSADAGDRRQLSVGRLAGLWLSGAVQHGRWIQT